MNITLNIQADSPEELMEAISGLSGVMGGASVDSPDVEKKEKKPTKSKTKPAEKAAEPEKKSSDKPEDDSEDPVSVEQLRAKAAEVAKAGKQPDVKALLDEFESKSISAVPEDQRAEFLTKLEKL